MPLEHRVLDPGHSPSAFRIEQRLEDAQALVWSPGQTPVHDHGSWGVVGILEGVPEERSYVRLSADCGADQGIELAAAAWSCWHAAP